MNEILTKLVTQQLVGIERFATDSWTFSLSGGCSIAVECSWRLTCEGRILTTGRDDGQAFGLPLLVDSAAIASTQLKGRAVVSADVRDPIADLIIRFQGGSTLEAFADSSGYESWHVTTPSGELIACGGGKLSRL